MTEQTNPRSKKLCFGEKKSLTKFSSGKTFFHRINTRVKKNILSKNKKEKLKDSFILRAKRPKNKSNKIDRQVQVDFEDGQKKANGSSTSSQNV